MARGHEIRFLPVIPGLGRGEFNESGNLPLTVSS
jgi:hypothetical protein